MPVLIVVNGMPAAGKSTLAKWLSEKLIIPCLSKDDLKEFLFDNLGIPTDRDESMAIGRASVKSLYIIAEEYIASGKSIIIESAFYKEHAINDLEKIKSAHKVDILEIYLKSRSDVRRKRFANRVDFGDRHTGHVENDDIFSEPEEEVYKRYAPLNIGRSLEYDTTEINQELYDIILLDVEEVLNIRQPNKGEI